MNDHSLINAEIRNGVWLGEFSGNSSDALTIRVQLQTNDLTDVTCAFDETRGTWQVQAPIPKAMINDGLQTFTVSDSSGKMLTHFSLVAGEALDHDLRAELALLRAELDILKAAFRKHCAES